MAEVRMALNNETMRTATQVTEKSGKKVGVWLLSE